MPDSTKSWTLYVCDKCGDYGSKFRQPINECRPSEDRHNGKWSEVEVVEATRLREVEAERDTAQDALLTANQRTESAGHQLHRERVRLREALNVGKALASYTTGFSENRTVADAKETLDRILATLTDPEDDVGVGAEGPARPSREARGARGNPVIGADSSVGLQGSQVEEGKRWWRCPECGAQVPSQIPRCAKGHAKPAPISERVDGDGEKRKPIGWNLVHQAQMDLSRIRGERDSLAGSYDRMKRARSEALRERDSRLTKAEVREKLRSTPALKAAEEKAKERFKANGCRCANCVGHAAGWAVTAAFDAAFGDDRPQGGNDA